jgi:uncharacterized membrane protein
MGVGLGGFIDGIVLHQILQWHHMLTDTGDHPSTTVAGLQDNTLADGFFHLATWVFVAIAMVLTLRAWQRHELAPPWRSHVGMLLAGWGVFNLVEGLIDHQVLGIHHVRDDIGAPLGWDIGSSCSARCSSSWAWHWRGRRPRARECLEHPEDQQQHDGDDRRDDQRSEAAEAVREEQEQGSRVYPNARPGIRAGRAGRTRH